MLRLLSVNVGLPRDVTWNGKTVRTAVWKSPVTGRRMARNLDIDGDAQADLAGHGGEHRAVFVYQMDSYHYWEDFLGRCDFTFGQFGAGVGATPVMSMLHALAAERSQREIWWIYGARNRVDHPFAEESRSLVKQLSRGRGYFVYSRPAASDQVGADFDAPGHIDTALLRKVGVSQGSDFYLCGPSSFLQNMRDGLGNWGVLAENVHKEIFGSLEAITPGMAQVDHTLIYPKGRPDLSPRSHSRVAGLPPLGIRNLGACLNWRKRVMFWSDGRAGVESVTPA